MLVGRDRERELLGHVLDAARAGRSAVLALVGEIGVGKSALLEHAREAAAGMHVLQVRGTQSEAHIPFAGLFELLRPALGQLDQVPGPQREALEAALALRPARAQDRFAVGAATLGILAAHAESAPLLVLVDDAQWIDGSSADALLFAFRRLLADPIAVVIAVRAGEPSFLDGADLPVLQVGGLDREAAAQLLGRHTGRSATLPHDVVDRLHHGTGGNPLALLELAEDLATLEASPPPSPLPVAARIARVYQGRCAALPEPTRDLLLLAAADATEDLAVLARAAAGIGLDVDDLAAAESAGLVSVVAGRLEFRHPLVRSAVYAGAPAERRRRMHRALADVLPDSEADRRAWHLALGTLGPDEGASSTLAEAARRAHARSAYDVSSHAYERAGILAPEAGRRGELLLRAADSAWVGGLATRAVALLEDAGRYATTPAVKVRIEQLRGHICTRMGSVREGHRVLVDGAALAVDVDVDRAVVMLAEAVDAAFYATDPVGMQEAAAAIGPLLARVTTQRATLLGRLAEGMALIFGGGSAEAGAALVRSAADTVSDSTADDPRLLAWAATPRLWLRESSADRTAIDTAVDVARRQSTVGVLPFLLSHVAVDAMASDRWTEAHVAFAEAIALARETGQRTDLAFALARLAWLEARQGREQPCRDHASEALALAGDLGLRLSEIWATAALADLELGLGRLDTARHRFEAEQAALSAAGVTDVDLSPEPELLELDLRGGHVERARARLDAFLPRAAAKGQPWALARAARCEGLLAPSDKMDEPFTAALDAHARTPDAFETARTRLAYGGRLRRAGQRVRAREQLREAVRLFDRLEATPWADAARAELTATGEVARQRDPSVLGQLTAQEQQIAALLAAGRTTRETAAALFLSPKTVEYHLRSVYRKLGIGSRDELVRTMARGGAPGQVPTRAP